MAMSGPGTMAVSVFWGASFMFLLEMTAGVSPSLDKKIHPFRALESRKNFQHLSEKDRREDVLVPASVVIDTVSSRERVRKLAKPASFLLAPRSEEKGAFEESLGKDQNDPVDAQAQRVLQSSCAVGDPFTITSSAFPSMEGCLSDMGYVMDNKVAYESSSAAVASIGPSSSTTTDTSDALWFALEIDSGGNANYRCFSNEASSSLPHPVTATWICDVNGNDDYVAPTSSQFSTTCGCSTPAAAAATCNEGQSFAITSTVVPDVAGCYSDTGVVSEDATLYSQTGTDDFQQNIVRAFDAGDAGAPDIRWIVAYEVSSSTTTTESDLYCYSGDNPAHPVDVTSWYCFSGSGDEAELVSNGQFSISCGCSSTSPPPTPSQTPEPAPVGTPEPEVVPTPEPTPEPTPAPETRATPEPTTAKISPAPVVSATPDPPMAEPTKQSETPSIPPAAMPMTAAPQLEERGMLPTIAAPAALVPATPTPAAIISSSSSAPVVSTTSPPSAASRGITSSGSPAPTLSATEPMTSINTTPDPVSVTPRTSTSTMVLSPVEGTYFPSPTAIDTCNGAFQLTSSAAPVLEGCFATGVLETSTLYGEDVYGRIADSESVGTAGVAASTTENLDPSRWILGYSATDTWTDIITYCYSGESANEVHPADATWLCDLSGAGSDFIEVTDTDLALICGCSGQTPSPAANASFSGPTTSPSVEANDDQGEDQGAGRGSLSAALSIFITVGLGFASTVVLLAELWFS